MTSDRPESREPVKAIMKPCPSCGKASTVFVTVDQWEELKSPIRRKIQQILPDKSPEEREILITGYCLECQETIFAEDED